MKMISDLLGKRLCYYRLLFPILLVHLLSQMATAQAPTSFRIANGTSGENPAVLWVGVDQGFFRKHGLNVEVIYMRVGSLAASALVSGDVNAVLTSSNAVLNLAAGGLDVVIIGCPFSTAGGGFHGSPGIEKTRGPEGQIDRNPEYRRRRVGEQYAGDGLPRSRPGP
jgi:ABC-type nitrate/sulfonate/bicarbonate transport system substrate-binding protein